MKEHTYIWLVKRFLILDTDAKLTTTQVVESVDSEEKAYEVACRELRYYLGLTESEDNGALLFDELNKLYIKKFEGFGFSVEKLNISNNNNEVE